MSNNAPAHFRSVQSSPDADEGTAQTIGIMAQHIKDGANDPLVEAASIDAVRRFRGGPLARRGELEKAACSDFWWAKHFITFVHHDVLGREWKLDDPLQVLVTPEALIRMKRPEGDCAIFAMLVCSMLRCQQIPYELVTVAANPKEPGVYSHVHCRAVLPEGRLPLDASHGLYPGWEVPSVDVFRKQVWNEDGQPIADRSTKFAGLHSYSRPRRVGLYGGMGACGVDPSSGESWCSPDVAGGGGWDTFAQDLAKQFTTIFGRKIAPTTISETINPKTGQRQYIETPGQSTSLLSPQVSATLSSPWIIGGIAVGALLLISMKGKR